MLRRAFSFEPTRQNPNSEPYTCNAKDPKPEPEALNPTLVSPQDRLVHRACCARTVLGGGTALCRLLGQGLGFGVQGLGLTLGWFKS